jgi:hypothetical protein
MDEQDILNFKNHLRKTNDLLNFSPNPKIQDIEDSINLTNPLMSSVKNPGKFLKNFEERELHPNLRPTEPRRINTNGKNIDDIRDTHYRYPLEHQKNNSSQVKPETSE